MLTWILLFICLILIFILIKMRLDFERKTYEKANEIAKLMFQEWMNQDRQKLEEVIKNQYLNELERWKRESEKEIRKDAIKRSINTLFGKIGEEFAPLLLSQKYKANPKDFRHLGTPVDYIVFKGLSDEDSEVEVIFIEIKTGKNSNLPTREKKVKEAIMKNKVRYEVENLDNLTKEAKENIFKMLDQMKMI